MPRGCSARPRPSWWVYRRLKCSSQNAVLGRTVFPQMRMRPGRYITCIHVIGLSVRCASCIRLSARWNLPFDGCGITSSNRKTAGLLPGNSRRRSRRHHRAVVLQHRYSRQTAGLSSTRNGRTALLCPFAQGSRCLGGNFQGCSQECSCACGDNQLAAIVKAQSWSAHDAHGPWPIF